MLHYKLKFEPDDMVWVIEDNAVKCDRVVGVTLLKGGYYYVLSSGRITGREEEDKMFENRCAAERSLEVHKRACPNTNDGTLCGGYQKILVAFSLVDGMSIR